VAKFSLDTQILVNVIQVLCLNFRGVKESDVSDLWVLKAVGLCKFLLLESKKRQTFCLEIPRFKFKMGIGTGCKHNIVLQ
jgi:hypothetical protein